MIEIVLGLLLLSVTAGFVGAIFGIGGGVLLVPALTLLLHVLIRVAIGVSLISVVATSAGASAAFVRDHWTNLRVAMALEVATTSGALAGATLAALVSARVLEGLFEQQHEERDAQHSHVRSGARMARLRRRRRSARRRMARAAHEGGHEEHPSRRSHGGRVCAQ
jgi:hypothetical protein